MTKMAISLDDTDEKVYISISRRLKEDIDSHRADLSYDSYIRELLVFFTVPPHTVRQRFENMKQRYFACVNCGQTLQTTVENPTSHQFCGECNYDVFRGISKVEYDAANGRFESSK